MMRLYVYFVKARDVILVYMSWNRAKVQLCSEEFAQKKTKKHTCVFKAKRRKKKFKITFVTFFWFVFNTKTDLRILHG